MKRITNVEKKYVVEVLKNGFKTTLNNVFNSRLEQKFSDIFKQKFAIGHVNGTTTLHTALAAGNIKKNDEVIVPPLTMSSPSLAVLHNNSIPIFADIEKNTFLIDPVSVRKNITEKTKAIITVSLYGLSPNYRELTKIARDNELILIEDNAQCLFGQYYGKLVGTFGDFSSFSFQASKHITSGEGGMLLTNNPTFSERARKFSNLGYSSLSSQVSRVSRDDIQNPYYDRHVCLGYNYRMSELNAAVALAQLERAKELVKMRMDIGQIYSDAIGVSKKINAQFTPEECIHSYWAYCFILKTKEPEKDWFTLKNDFAKRGGDNFYGAWKLTYKEPLFNKLSQTDSRIWQDYNDELCPHAEYVQPRMVQLKTNYYHKKEARIQAKIMRATLKEW